jgi:hypothetical protein
LTEAARHQRVRFATAPEGLQIAFEHRPGPVGALKAPNWMSHLEYEWRNHVWGTAFAALSRRWRPVRFDQRGNGLSDWDAEEISEDAMIGDMSAVVDTAGPDRHLPLVLRCKGDRVAPLEEGARHGQAGPGRELHRPARQESGAASLAGTPTFDQFLEEATSFVGMHAGSCSALSARGPL